MLHDTSYLLRPGIHTYNRSRKSNRPPSRVSTWRRLLLLIGLACLGYYTFTLADQTVYQTYQNWAFDQHIAGRSVGFRDYVREQTPFAFLAGPPVPAQPVTPALRE